MKKDKEYSVESLLTENAYDLEKQKGVGHATILRRYEQLRKIATELAKGRRTVDIIVQNIIKKI